ncbi:MAG: hypothetical protein IT281_10210 [Ignavibacteria bacterium]|nr:hypothetical protein [Ignavibacteria bacterium]
MQLVFPDDEAVQPHLKLLAMAKRWKKVQDDITVPMNETVHHTTVTTTTTMESATEEIPLPESRIDDEEMNDES